MPSPVMSQNLSSIRSSQTKSDNPYNLSLKHDDGNSDNENDSQIMNAGVVCCNTKLIQALKDPRLAETLTLLADPTVLNSLWALKKNQSGFTGALSSVPVQTNFPTSQPPSPESLGLNIPPVQHNIKKESQTTSGPLSLDNFDKTVGSPKQKNPMPKHSISESPKSLEALKKFKSNAEPPVATMVTLADIKRQKYGNAILL